MARAAAILARLRRRRARGALSPAERTLADRSAADAIDRAMRLDRWAHAERFVTGAAAIEPKSPRLIERVVRVHLARGNPRAALELIERAGFGSPPPAAVRLLRAACLVHLGARDRAARDLRRWMTESHAPADAGVILALLEWHAGDEHAATLTLLRNVRWLEHPASLELLLVIAAGSGRHEQAEAWARRLTDARLATLGTTDPGLAPLSLDVPALLEARPPDPAHVDTLARELRADEPVIPALVEAQRRRPDPATADLLSAAIATALDDLIDPVVALEALATLAVVRARPHEARTWIDEGLRLHPRSHVLTRLDRELAGPADRRADDVIATIGPTDRPEDQQEDAA